VSILSEFAALVARWRPLFKREATWVRVASVLTGLVVGVGRRTVTSSIRARGQTQRSWSADYLAFARAPWSVDEMMGTVLDTAVETQDQLCPGAPIVLGVDDTSCRKTGHTIKGASWMRDPLSPPFHVNLRYGLRFLHFGLLLPLHMHGDEARAISVGFELAPALAKPKHKAPPEDHAAWRAARKRNNLSQRAVDRIAFLRKRLDAGGQRDRCLRIVGDSSFVNRIVMRGLPERVELIGRTRKNLALFAPAALGTRKVYGERLATPEQVRLDASRPWSECEVHYGNGHHSVRYKEVTDVLWRSAARRRKLRLIIAEPTPFNMPGKRRKQYREPSYLLTTDLTTPTAELLQNYFDRWQLEVQHRDLKTDLGVGQQQVHADLSVSRLHTAYAALWSMLTLATLRTLGPKRTEQYPARPRWYAQKHGDRPSALDIAALLRAALDHEAAEIGRDRRAMLRAVSEDIVVSRRVA
jgi:hypothetical protein